MPGAIVSPADTSAATRGLFQSLSWDLFEATADVATAGAVVGDGAGAGLVIVAAAVETDPVVDLAGIMIGVAALLLAFAIAVLLLRPLAWVLGHIPIIGGPVSDALDSASNAIWNGVKDFLGDCLRVVWSAFVLLWNATLGFPMAVGKALATMAGVVSWIINGLIPQVEGWVLDQDAISEARARDYTNSVKQQSDAYSRQLYYDALRRENELYQAEVNYTRAVQQEDTLYAQQLHADAVARANAAWVQAQAAVAQEAMVRNAEVRQAEQQAFNEARQVQQQAHTELGAAITALTGLFTGALSATTATLSQEITTTATTAATATQTVEDKLDQYLQKCGIPICNNLSGLSNAVKDLLSLFGDAAILALLYELIHNPAGVADDGRQAVVPIVHDTASAVLQAA